MITAERFARKRWKALLWFNMEELFVDIIGDEADTFEWRKTIADIY